MPSMQHGVVNIRFDTLIVAGKNELYIFVSDVKILYKGNNFR